MKMRWRKIAAILGVVTMIGGVFPVQASELPIDPEAAEETEEVESAEDALGGEEADEEVNSAEDVLGGEEAEEEDAETVALTSAIATLAVDNSDEIQVATDLGWSEETPGMPVFYNPNKGNVTYQLHLFKDGSRMRMIFYAYSSGEETVSVENVIDSLEESGTYTYQVEVFPDGEEPDYDLSSGYVSEVSSAFVYTRPDEQMGVPQSITCSSTGLVSWDAVDHEDYLKYYMAELAYADDNSYTGYTSMGGYGSSKLSADFSDRLASGHDYYVRVRAYSNNINRYAHSDWSDYIPVITAEAADSVNGKLDDCMSDMTEQTVESAVTAVKEAFASDAEKKKLQVAMQTNTETQERISKLEEQYMESKGVSTKVNPGDTGVSSVKLLGAALNATQAGQINFNMSKADEETQKDLLTNTQYKNAIVLNLDLEGAGISEGQALDIPVTVTMSVPEGMDPSRLVILHYNSNGTYESIPVRRNGDGTVSFTVTHFSYFAFAETETTSSSNSGAGVVTYNSQGGSTVTSVYVEPWKPTTPDEIKRYSVVGKEKPVFTVNTAASYPVTIVNAMQGKLCFDSFEAVLGDYTIGRTYNVLPYGKMVYKMDKKAKITLNIPKALQKDKRTFKMICVTQKGLPIVLNDLDTDPKTITFETDTFYAYALIYKDAAVSK